MTSRNMKNSISKCWRFMKLWNVDIFRSKFEQIFIDKQLFIILMNCQLKFAVVKRVDPAKLDKSIPAPMGFLVL